jgi:hypothetical protein
MSLLTTLQARTANFPIAGHRIAVLDVLGNMREAEINDGGGFPWFNCPFCSSGVYVNGHGPDVPDAVISINCECVNPWCLANPNMPKAEAERLYKVERQRREQEAERERNHRSALRRIEEGRQADEERRAATIVEAGKRGACVRCALRTGRFVKHRAGCTDAGRHKTRF